MKRAALYMRVSTLDQHPETQLYDLRQSAAPGWKAVTSAGLLYGSIMPPSSATISAARASASWRRAIASPVPLSRASLGGRHRKLLTESSYMISLFQKGF
jgi:hypothetical protein